VNRDHTSIVSPRPSSTLPPVLVAHTSSTSRGLNWMLSTVAVQLRQSASDRILVLLHNTQHQPTSLRQPLLPAASARKVRKSVESVHFIYVKLPWRNFSSLRYDSRSYFNVRSKADTSHLNLPRGTKKEKSKKKKKRVYDKFPEESRLTLVFVDT